uniref:FkbH like protein n=1 Tax=Solibacter usitatus (strain Ellin6076) TaxID=234267 RepID=Q01X43_SOLUE
MKLTEALEILRNRARDAPRFAVTLACGFTPLHLQTFLRAHLQTRLPARSVEISVGLYGDITGTVENLTLTSGDAAAIVVEWADLDARLGYRHSGGWGPSELMDIVMSAERAVERLAQGIRRAPDSLPIAVSLPTLPMAPVFYASMHEASSAEMKLQEAVIAAGHGLSALPNVAILSGQLLGEQSPPGSRYDLKSDLLSGLPYTIAHASAMGNGLAELIVPGAPKKGLITDLDDTLWNGIVGDAGVENITWDLASHSQVHGLYQQLLRALAEQGVLIAAASKNDPELVDQAFARTDILLPRDRVFPMEAHWHAKSVSVGRILRTWNIGADSVVFVDDNAMELAEVGEAHPGIECVRFPKSDDAAAAGFLRDLRQAFAKRQVNEEDGLRRESIRSASELHRAVEDGQSAPDAFLAEMKARMKVDFEPSASDARVLELINKTNQFNLNGIRYGETDWRNALARDCAFAASVAYEDRFGPLGKIAVMAGYRNDASLRITTWVMSCRAFARRIEHQCVRLLFERFGVEEIEFDFAATPRNGPVQEFLAAITAGKPPFLLRRDTFEDNLPRLFHEVTIETPRSFGAAPTCG